MRTGGPDTADTTTRPGARPPPPPTLPPPASPTLPRDEAPPAAPPLLGIAALQLQVCATTADTLAHIDALLDSECRRLGVLRWDGDGRAIDGGSGGQHLDLLVLPELFNGPHLVCETAWYRAERLDGAHTSPSLAALATWAARYRCYVAATLLEATSDGHIYNSLVLVAPDGSFVVPQHGAGSSDASSVALLRKQRAASLEAFVFRGCGSGAGEPATRVINLDVAPLLAKRSGSGSGGGGGSSSCTLRLAFAICYENMCAPPMEAILEAHRREPLDLLATLYCAMAARPDHPLFKWPAAAAERFAAAAAGATCLHAIKLRTPAVAAYHSGPWASPLPRLLPWLSRHPVPLEGPMLGCSAIYSCGGAVLAQMRSSEEGLAVAELPLLQRPRSAAATPAASVSMAGSALAAVVGEVAAAAADAGPGAPFAHYRGGYVVEPAAWQVWAGFPLMEALGSLAYHAWQAPLRRRIARAVYANGTWRGPVPPLEGGPSCRRAALVAAAAAGMALAAFALQRHNRVCFAD